MKKIHRQMKTFKKYFEWVGYDKLKTDDDIYDALIEAVKESERKGYHGDFKFKSDFQKPV